MKKTKLLVIAACTIAIFGMSCKKNADVGNASASPSFAKLNVSSSFNWSPTKRILLVITGMPTTTTVVNTLRIVNPKNGESYYTGLHKLDENVSLKLNIPSVTDSIQIQFGSIRKNYTAQFIGISADYLPTIVQDNP